MEAHIKEHPAWFHRYEAIWTPTILIFAPEGVERFRIEGYLPKDEFRAHLELGLARIAVMKKKWADAKEIYDGVLERAPETKAAAEAVYWSAVCHYKATQDHTSLGGAAKRLQQQYADSIWAKKALPWGG